MGYGGFVATIANVAQIMELDVARNMRQLPAQVRLTDAPKEAMVMFFARSLSSSTAKGWNTAREQKSEFYDRARDLANAQSLASAEQRA